MSRAGAEQRGTATVCPICWCGYEAGTPSRGWRRVARLAPRANGCANRTPSNEVPPSDIGDEPPQ